MLKLSIYNTMGMSTYYTQIVTQLFHKEHLNLANNITHFSRSYQSPQLHHLM